MFFAVGLKSVYALLGQWFCLPLSLFLVKSAKAVAPISAALFGAFSTPPAALT